MIHHFKIKFLLVLYGFLYMVLSVLSIYYEKYTEDNLSTASARYDKPSVSSKQADRIREYISTRPQIGLQGITLWNLQKDELLQSQLTELSSLANVIELSGDMSSILPMIFLYGNGSPENDYEGCIIDSVTSYKLFGTTNAVGNCVLWNKKRYIVRGVAKTQDKVMLIRPADRNHLYSNIEAYYPEQVHKRIADNEGRQLEQLLLACGLPDAEVVIDGVLTLWLLHIIIRLPMAAVILTTVIYLVKYVCQKCNSILLLLLYGTGALMIILFMIWVSDFIFHIPSQFIPTRWSDFHFYSDKYHEWQEQFRKYRSCKLMSTDLLRYQILLKCSVYTIVNGLLLFLFWHGIRKKSFIIPS